MEAVVFADGTAKLGWQGWYRKAIPHAEDLYAQYLKEREAEEGS